ncbi:hypothetical protein [Streptomyces shenzhenensis]|uniref:hypothetical protein n=1 Tax=Streptomyces shenzhenensis TaxID=943815 RepID=UPI001F2FF47E|nr:hypothetical protein [Streptomyces shenzhenensis]
MHEHIGHTGNVLLEFGRPRARAATGGCRVSGETAMPAKAATFLAVPPREAPAAEKGARPDRGGGQATTETAGAAGRRRTTSR